MLRGVLGNAQKKITIVRKMIRKKDRTSVDPSLSGIWVLILNQILDSINTADPEPDPRQYKHS